MAISLNDLSTILDEHFRMTPPLDSKNVPISGAISNYGDGISLGDGASADTTFGLENIQVVEKAGYFDKVKQISMKDWLQKTIKENPAPEAIAASLQGLLENGQVSYFEQGREFATQLSLDPQTNKLNATPIKRQALPPVKPTLTPWQKFLRLVRFLPDAELNAYNRDLLSYEVKKKALATSEVRAASGTGIDIASMRDDGKGRILGGSDKGTEVRRFIFNRNALSGDDDMVANQNPEESADLKIGANTNLNDFFAQMYPKGKSATITTMQEHIDARVAKQQSFPNVTMMKAPMSASNIRIGDPLVSTALKEVMEGKDNEGYSEELQRLTESRAYKSLFGKQGLAAELVATNKVFDQFAQNLEKYPIKGISPQAIENLLDVCIDPHKKLSAALEAGKNPEMNKVANNKQPEKQIEKEAPEKKPSVPKM